MTKTLFLLQFFLILLIFVFPPLFAGEASCEAINWGKINYFSLFSLAAAIFLSLQDKKNEKSENFGGNGLVKAAIFSSCFLTTFGTLLILGIILNFFSEALGSAAGAKFAKPEGLAQIFICVLSLFSSAFFEERVYRKYLPDAARKILRSKKFAAIFSEVSALLLFAFAHRWQGWLAVLNALLGGIALRLCAVKSKSLIPGTAAHFLYNLFALFAALA